MLACFAVHRQQEAPLGGSDALKATLGKRQARVKLRPLEAVAPMLGCLRVLLSDVRQDGSEVEALRDAAEWTSRTLDAVEQQLANGDTVAVMISVHHTKCVQCCPFGMAPCTTLVDASYALALRKDAGKAIPGLDVSERTAPVLGLLAALYVTGAAAVIPAVALNLSPPSCAGVEWYYHTPSIASRSAAHARTQPL